MTFLPPEEVRSGFTDSAFSLLDDLDLLPFSFSAESGESEKGLALFWKESGKRGLQFSSVWQTCWGMSSSQETADVLVPFSSFLRLGSWLVSRSFTE